MLGVTQTADADDQQHQVHYASVYKKEVCGADAQGEVNWSQFGMKMSKFGEGDAGRMVLHIQVEGSKPEQTSSKPE